MTQANDQPQPASAAPVEQELGLLPIGPHDHPDPKTMVWSESELRAIRQYAARCVAAERDRMRDLCAIDMASATLKASELAQAAERERCAKLCEELEARVWRTYKNGGAANQHTEGRSDGAGECAALIRGA